MISIDINNFYLASFREIGACGNPYAIVDVDLPFALYNRFT